MKDQKKILVVDDDAEMRLLLRDFLTSRGYRVTTAGNGKAALGSLGENPDLVISDIHMKPMGGLELLDELRRVRPEIPVFLISAFGDAASERELKSHGARRFFPKPFRLGDVAAAVSSVLAA